MIGQTLSLLKLHIMQAKRSLAEIGLFRFLFLVGIFALLILALFQALQSGENLEIATGATLFFMLLLQIQRTDKLFLKIHFENHRQLLTVEYLILSFPVLLFLVYFLKWELLLVMIAGTFLIPFMDIKWRSGTQITVFQKWIPDDAFEWKAGVRKMLPLLFIVLIAGLGFSFFTGAVPLAMFVLGVLPIRFFEKGEPVQMLIASEQPASKLILLKFKCHLIIFSLLALPLIMAFLLFHPQLWYIVVAEYFLFVSLHFYFITLKYAFYVPNEKPAAIEIFSTFGAVGIVVPVLLPIVWALTLWMFLRARRNLKPYLNDYNS